jgi:hypothetical protein
MTGTKSAVQASYNISGSTFAHQTIALLTQAAMQVKRVPAVPEVTKNAVGNAYLHFKESTISKIRFQENAGDILQRNVPSSYLEL